VHVINWEIKMEHKAFAETEEQLQMLVAGKAGAR
jgi:hypothetical protein